MSRGKIGVSSQNLFPIIKKFLYSDHDIFLREIVSNAIDATQKLKTLSSSGDFKEELGSLHIKISFDKKAGTITVSDRGIGMTEEEVKKYINQIAFSSAEDFLEKYKDKTNAIIGHFGLGFYSSFMVSNKVEIITKSYQKDAEAIHWVCTGSPAYTLEKTTKKERGTDIIMHISKEEKQFLEKDKINEILNKYCKFLPIEIVFGKKQEWKDGKYVDTDKDNVINETTPTWTKKPVDLKEEDYQKFYQSIYPMNENPLFHIHLNVDYPFNLTGILYFPKIKNNFEIQKNKIQLYCNQVFVTDIVEGIVPEFLTLLHGVIDSPDIPLNVSRSYLQSDSNVKKISNHITKKVSDSLENIFKDDRTKFEEKWDDLKVFIQFGMLTDEKFAERAMKFCLFKNIDGKYFTFDEYETLIKTNQTNKDKKIVILYAKDTETQFTSINEAKNKGYDVLLMDGHLDTPFINFVEQKKSDFTFSRVDADVLNKLIEKEDKSDDKSSVLSENEKQELTPVFKIYLDKLKNKNFIIQVESLGKQTAPVSITQAEFMRRMKEMTPFNQGVNFYGEMPDSFNLVVNSDHKLVKSIIKAKNQELKNELKEFSDNIKDLTKEKDALEKQKTNKKEEEIPEKDKKQLESLNKNIQKVENSRNKLLEKFSRKQPLVKQLIDLALLSNNMLKGKELATFINRSFKLIQ